MKVITETEDCCSRFVDCHYFLFRKVFVNDNEQGDIMAVKYHVNPETGRANICRAEKGDCPLKGTDGKPAEHFTDKSAAKAHGEKMLASIHGATKTLKKPAKETKAAKTESKKKTVEATPSQQLAQRRKELAELREAKERTTDPEEIRRINGIIRGKSINLKRLVDADRAARPRVADVSDNSVKFYSAPKKEAVVEPVKEGKTDSVAQDFLNKERSMADNKQMLIDYVSDGKNFAKVREDFEKAGYDADSSTYLRNLRNGDAGANNILRQAQKDALEAKKNGASITVSDILIYADESAEDYYDSIGADRFNDNVSRFEGTEEVNLDEIEEAPEFLKDDPDFAIEDEDEFETDEEF